MHAGRARRRAGDADGLDNTRRGGATDRPHPGRTPGGVKRALRGLNQGDDGEAARSLPLRMPEGHTAA